MLALGGAEQWRPGLPPQSRSCSASGCGFRITSYTSVAEGRTDTPGSRGGSRGVIPTLARMLVAFDRLDPAQTMLEELVTDSTPPRTNRAAGTPGSARCLAVW